MVVGYVNINETIIIIVYGAYTHGSSVNINDSHFFCHVFKGTISIIVIKNIRLCVIGQWTRKAVRCIKIFIIRIKIQVIAYIKIEEAIIIVIQPNSAYTDFIFS